MNIINEKVSIIMPAFNSKNTIHDSVKSVINQTYKDWELIVIDDYSTDDSVEFLSKHFNDNRIIVLTNSLDKGAANARNIGIRRATGNYLAFLDSDDIWDIKKLEIQVKEMRKMDASFTYMDYIINKNGELSKKITPEKVTYQTMRRYCSIGCLTVMIDISKVEKPIIPNLKKRNDYAMWLKALRYCDGYRIDGLYATYNRNQSSLSSGKKVKLIHHHYLLFRESERYSIVKSIWYTIINITNYLLQGKKSIKKIEM